MTTTSRPPRAALYARCSTTDQNLDVQLHELRQAAQQRGWVVAGEYLDEGVSGAQDSRPGLDGLLADAQAGKLDLVVVWRLDRLGRSLKHLLKLLDELTSYGVGFTSLRDPGIDTTTASGRLLLQLLGAFAEFERNLIRERVVAGVRRAQANGVHCGRPKVELDLRPARALLNEGRAVREVASVLGVSRSTLRRRLEEAVE